MTPKEDRPLMVFVVRLHILLYLQLVPSAIIQHAAMACLNTIFHPLSSGTTLIYKKKSI